MPYNGKIYQLINTNEDLILTLEVADNGIKTVIIIILCVLNSSRQRVSE